MAITVPQGVPVHPLSVEDYHRMIAAGILGEDDRVELLEGILVEMCPISRAHQRVVNRLKVHFAPAMASGRAIVQVQGPITRRDHRSEPEPDLLVVRDDSGLGHPDTGLLAVEVSVTSHGIDRVQKARLYARAGIPEYWLIDVPGQAVEVRTDPCEDGYAACRTLRAGDQLVTLAVPDAPVLDVSALFA